MLGTWAFTSFLSLQVSHLILPVTLAASLPPLALPNYDPSTLPLRTQKDTNLAIVNPASGSTASLTAPNKEVSVLFYNEGSAIPPSELLTALSATIAAVRVYLPDSASYPISTIFEKNTSFPETTGNSVSVAVLECFQRLSWLQLSDALMMVEEYMLGTSEPGHSIAHSQTLDFSIWTAEVGRGWIDVAHGVVKFAVGDRAVGKRSLLSTPTLQLTNVNSSSLSLSAPTLPIIYTVATNLDLNITSLGTDILPTQIITTIEDAYSDIVLNHEDIDSPIPFNEPYSFNKTFGPWTERVNAKIEISAYRGKELTWAVLYLLLYGLKEFMELTGLFNALAFEIEDKRAGTLGRGQVEYGPAGEMASVERLRMV